MVDNQAARILLVEDESIVAADIEDALKRQGYAVVGTAGTGERAIQLADEKRPDLILMDIRLQGPLSGIEAAEAIGNRHSIPIIYLTAYSDETTLQRAKVTQPYGYLLKPFGGRELHAAIETALYHSLAERRLADSERRNRLIIENAFDAFVTIDESGRITEWNRQAETTFGWAAGEALGRPFFEAILPLSHREIAAQRLAQFLNPQTRTSTNGRIEMTAMHRNGKEFPVEVSFAAIVTAEGRQLNAFIHDISERKRAEEELRKSASLFDNARWGIAAIDREGKRFEKVNPEFARMHGFSREEISHLPVESLLPADCIDKFRQHVLAVNEHGKNVLETHHLKKDGSEFPVQCDAVAIRDEKGNVISVLTLLRDLTDSKRLEAEQNRRRELERSNAELEHFAHVTSHDLQEPLRTLSTYTQLLTRKLGDKIDEEDRELVQYIVGGAHRMQRLIAALLTYSRVGGTESQKAEEVEVGTVLNNTLETLQRTIKKNDAQIRFDGLPKVVGYPTHIDQLFQNLIGNALKFRTEETPPVIHIDAARDGHFWRFCVRDNGIGFDSEYATKVFDMFRRLHSQEKYAGTGLGLATCKKIVELHGGRIWAESQPNDGASFFFTLPAVDAVPDRRGNRPSSPLPPH